MILFKNDLFTIEERNSQIFLLVVKEGAGVQDVISVCNMFPRIKITKPLSIKESLEVISEKANLIGTLKAKIELIISKDMMSAHMIVNLRDDELSAFEVSELSKKILVENEITFGYINEVIDNMPLRSKVLVAEGKKAIDGIDAIIEYYELSENKPLMNEDGSVDHYEMQLIDNVHTGDWLGRKIPPTKGIPGVSIKNEEIVAKIGRDLKLKYEEATIRHITYENNNEEIFAKCDGAVCFKRGQICIDNHLVIHGDVDYNTGHIEFDGYVTIEGTVKDKFNVVATKDIAINGPMGIGAVGLIHSKDGSVSVKGGINGKGEAQIIAGHNILTKYSNEASLKAGNTIHVGLYSIDSDLNAKKIMLPAAGKIIGGNTYATHKVETGSIGNKMEKPTKVYVEGFIREDVHDMMNFYQEKLKDLYKVVNKMRKELEIFEKNMRKLDERGFNTYNFMVVKYEQQVTEVNQVEMEMEKLNDILLTRGEGEITISKSVFPKTMLEMKKLQKRITDKMTGCFYVEGREIYHND